MDAKLFVSTFLLIFVAELGDKTQLAALARSAASDGGKWTVFFAASAALVLSTLVAVLFGQVLTAFIPVHVIKLTAGMLFLLFGGLILYDTLARPTAAAVEPAPVTAQTGVLSRAVLRIAADFEQASADDYAALAGATDNPATRRLLLALAEEERGHLRTMQAAAAQHPGAVVAPELHAHLPHAAELMHDVAGSTDPALAHAIEHETATARFYDELARLTPVPSLKQTFATLARAEHDHAARLRRAAGLPEPPGV